MDRMIGELEQLDGVLEGELLVDLPMIEGELIPLDDLPALSGDLVIQPTTEVDIPAYDGSYEITPVANADVVLSTSGKRMEDDITVFEIPYYETTNESGGYTVIIG